MTGFTSSPRLVKGGLVVLAPDGGAVRRMIALQMTSFPNSPRLLKGGIVWIDPASATAAYEAQQ